MRQYKVDGVKGEIIDIRLYPSPRSDVFVVTYGETYFNTTGHDVHVVLIKTNDTPVYPGNVYICPNGFDFAIDWIDRDTLGIFYRAGYYPDKRDFKTGKVGKFADFQYEKKIGGINVKFVPVDRDTMDMKRNIMDSKEIKSKK